MKVETLRDELLNAGATLVGIAEVKDALKGEISHLGRAIAICVNRNLNEDTVNLLTSLESKTARWLKQRGYRYLCIPPDSDRWKNTFISRLYPLFTHKIAATSAGLGWIGKNGLFINHRYGPRLSLATVLTDAPFQVGTAIEFSRCGDCSMCVEFCPSNALTGRNWSRYEPFTQLVRPDRCNSYKKNSRTVNGRPNCGLCINICPYGRKIFKSEVFSSEQLISRNS